MRTPDEFIDRATEDFFTTYAMLYEERWGTPLSGMKMARARLMAHRLAVHAAEAHIERA